MSIPRFKQNTLVVLLVITSFSSGVVTAFAYTPSTPTEQVAQAQPVMSAPMSFPFGFHPVQTHSPNTLNVALPPPVAPFPFVAVPEVPKPVLQPQRLTQAPKKSVPKPQHQATQPIVASGSIQVVIAFALSQQRKPYRWGAAGPNAYDCSGLVLVSFSKIGIKLPHFTGAMVNNGRAVSRSQLQPGDIIFPSRGHVGIYLGNNTFIHAPTTGDVVKISPVYAFYAGRRLVG